MQKEILNNVQVEKEPKLGKRGERLESGRKGG